MAAVGDATSIDRSTAMASVDTNKRRATEAARALIGMAVVERAFHFLDGPADVLCAATACRRWHELATADSVWRVKARREGMVEKAGVFEVALPAAAAAATPAAAGGEDGAGSSTSSIITTATTSTAAATARKEDELAGVGLAFYAQIYVLKVPIAHSLRLRPIAPTTTTARLALAASVLTTTPRPRSRPLGRGTR